MNDALEDTTIAPSVEIAPEAPPAATEIVEEGYVPTSEPPPAEVLTPPEGVDPDSGKVDTPAAMDEKKIAEFNQDDGEDEVINADPRELPVMLDICKRMLDAANLKLIAAQARTEFYGQHLQTQSKIIDDCAALLKTLGVDFEVAVLSKYAVKSNPENTAGVIDAEPKDGGEY